MEHEICGISNPLPSISVRLANEPMRAAFLLVFSGALCLAAFPPKFDIFEEPEIQELFYYPIYIGNVTANFLHRHKSKINCMQVIAERGTYEIDRYEATIKVCSRNYNITLDFHYILDAMTDRDLSLLCSSQIRAVVRGQSCGKNVLLALICDTYSSVMDFAACFRINNDPDEGTEIESIN